MLIRLSRTQDLRHVQASLHALGLWTKTFQGQNEVLLQVKKHSSSIPLDKIIAIKGVLEVIEPKSPHPKVDEKADNVITFDRISTTIGGSFSPVLMSGPCSIESELAIHQSAAVVAAAGGTFLRGGAFKPRTSPYSFNGHGNVALTWLQNAAQAHSLGIITEALSSDNVEDVAEVADIIQIGARNMQNFPLLRVVGQMQMPVLLKRGLSATVDEWLLAGEHLLAAGASDVLFCERGIRSYDASTRNLLDLGAAALLKHVHKQIVIIDPSHGLGRRDLIPHLSRAAIALGVDGLLIESHHNAGYAKSDGPQALNRSELEEIGQLLNNSKLLLRPTAEHTNPKHKP